MEEVMFEVRFEVCKDVGEEKSQVVGIVRDEVVRREKGGWRI